MLQKRADHDEEVIDRTGEMAALETARSATESSGKAAEAKPEEERVSMFWRLFGGTILSIVALVSITLYNNMSSSITELRAEVSREREERASLVKKDEYNARVTAQYERMRGIDSLKVELEGMKEKVHTNATALDTVKRDTAVAVEAVKKDTTAAADAQKKDAGALELLKERIAALEGVKKDIAGLDALKEKVTNAIIDLKAIRDDVMKLTVEVDRNRASDAERKVSRDAQAKQIDEALKELQKGLQDCREKLARLEGAQPKPPADYPPVPFAPRPAPSGKPNP
jgi:DNA repair exonuclease SbcCD ATPase subunit